MATATKIHRRVKEHLEINNYHFKSDRKSKGFTVMMPPKGKLKEALLDVMSGKKSPIDAINEIFESENEDCSCGCEHDHDDDDVTDDLFDLEELNLSNKEPEELV